MLRSTEKKQKLTRGLPLLGLDPKTHLHFSIWLHLYAGLMFTEFPKQAASPVR